MGPKEEVLRHQQFRVLMARYYLSDKNMAQVFEMLDKHVIYSEYNMTNPQTIRIKFDNILFSFHILWIAHKYGIIKTN